MVAMKAKRMLLQYHGKKDISNIYMQKKESMSPLKMKNLWNSYVEFMVLKTLGNDVGSHSEMMFSASTLIDELWHCHVLCTYI